MADSRTNPPIPDRGQARSDEASGDAEALALYRAAWEEASRPHQERCSRYDAQERAFHAELGEKDTVGYHNLAPMYAYEVVELLASNLVDDHPRPTVRPLVQGAEAAADLLEKLILQHRERDGRGEKLPLWVKRALVHNVSPAKMSWKYEEADRKKRVFQPNPFEINGYLEGSTETQRRPVCDRPSLTLIDPRDFLWQPSAKTLDESAYVIALYRESKESLRKQAKKGDYGIYKNLDQITGTAPPRDSRCGKNEILVAEFWTRDRLIVVANNDVVIRDDENPYWHGELPFVAMVLIQDLRRLEGISVVESIAPLQRALWRSLNDRLDMSEIVLNPPMVVRPGIDQDENVTFKPGARFRSDDPAGLTFIQTPVQILAAAIENAAQIKGDLRDISGAAPALSGAASETLDQKTATGISIIQSVAQQRLKRMRSQAGVAEKRCGQLEVAMIQQLTRKPDAIRVSTKEGFEFKPFTPAELQPDVEFDIDDVNESLDQQRKREEATIKLQTLLALNGAQPGLVNLQVLGEDFLEAFDEEHPERFFHDQQQPQFQAAGPMPPGGAPPPQGPPQSFEQGPPPQGPPQSFEQGPPPMPFAPHTPPLAAVPGGAA